MYIIFAIIVIIFALLKYARIAIDWKSFIMPTLPLSRGLFGVYCFTGKQGDGKTYSLTKFVVNHAKKEDKKIYSNMTLNGVRYTKIRSVDHLLSLRDEQEIYIVYDEIFTLLGDESKIPPAIKKELRIFLSQQRKQGNILLTTAQEWLDIPIQFRRYIRIQIDCRTIPWGRFGGLLREYYNDGYNMKYDKDEGEYIAPLISQKFSKYEKKIMQSYDTFERLEPLPKT